jgi:hypothetical protein
MAAALLALCSFVIAETPAERVAKSLKKAGYFSVWPVGVAAAESANEKVFAIFMQQNPTTDDALRLIADGTLAAKVYGFLALKELSPELFSQIAPRFYENRRDEVAIMSGCSPSMEALGSLVKKISEGKIVRREKK